MGTRGCLPFRFQQFLNMLWNGTHDSIKPKSLEDLKHCVSLKAEQFRGSAQQDAHEFLIFFLDLLHEVIILLIP